MKTWPTKKVPECIEKLPKKAGIPRSKYKKEGKFPVVDQGQDFVGGYTDDEVSVYKDDLPVIVFGDHTRSIKFIDFPFAVGADGTKVLKPKDFLDPKYFYLALLSLDIQSRGYARHFRILKDKEIPLPPLAEQKKIVAKLERVLGKISEAKKLRAEARENADSLLPAELHKIFTTPHLQHPYKLENVGVSSTTKNGWQEKELKEVVDQKTAKNMKENLPFVGMEDVESETGKFLGSLEPRSVRSATFHFDKDSVLYGKLRPYLNKVLLPDFEGHCSTEFIPLKPQNGVSREWVAYWLKSPQVVEGAMSTNTGSRMPRANMKDLMRFKIPLPPLAEQKKIVARLDALSEKIQKLQAYQKSTQSDFLALEQSVLSKAFGYK